MKGFLVRSKIYLLERKVSSTKCNGKVCQVCLNNKETDTFESFQTKKKNASKINHHLDCNDKCLIYCLVRFVLYNMYVSQQTNFASIGTITRKMIEKPWEGKKHMQAKAFEHFAADNHNSFLKDCSITLVNITDGSEPTRREEYWRKVLKTVVPYGLNTLNYFLALLYIFRGRSLINIKYIMLNLTSVFCKVFNVYIMGCSINLFSGNSYLVETNQLICIAN